jgi:prepilin-type N-terminal cleavage/methylation domain-containing protein
MAPSSARRSGFTLVELLAVIMIIALLAALVTPAVMKSLSSSRAAAVKAEIELLNTALMNYKNEYGSFPPSDMRGLWNNTTNSVNTGHPAYKHLQRIFPRIAEPTGAPLVAPVASPYYWMAQMSPAQALVFWLQGFFDNPRYPLTNYDPVTSQPVLSVNMPRAGTANANRNKLFDFDESRLYAADVYWAVSSPFGPIGTGYQAFFTRNAAPSAFAREYPVYFPNQANTGLPYVYFSSSGYSTLLPNPFFASTSVTAAIGPGLLPDLFYTATSLNGDNSAIVPYFNTANCAILTPPPNPQFSWAQLHMNPDTFQLIAAGADGTYGSAAAGFPLRAPVSFSYPAPSGQVAVGPIDSVRNVSGHEDNITNFAIGRLKEAAERLSQ